MFKYTDQGLKRLLRGIDMQQATYLNPFTDFGFKKLFGEEYNKDLLIDFLNQLLKKEQGCIKTQTSLKNEHLGRSEADRRAVYDLYWKIYLEMPKFAKTLEELETRFDKWLYVLKNLERLHDIPEKLKDRIFRKLFAAAEIAKFTPEEAMAYEDSLKVYRDLKNSLDTAREEGREEGIAQVAKNLLQMGQSIADVSKATGLSLEALDKLQASDENSVKEPAAHYKTTKKPKSSRKASKPQR